MNRTLIAIINNSKFLIRREGAKFKYFLKFHSHFCDALFFENVLYLWKIVILYKYILLQFTLTHARHQSSSRIPFGLSPA
jgi:hypothetical protein